MLHVKNIKVALKPFQCVSRVDIVDQVDVGPLVDDFAAVSVDVDLLEDGRSDPRLEQQPASEIDASNLAVFAADNFFRISRF